MTSALAMKSKSIANELLPLGIADVVSPRTVT
jgi:hypothetical protein